MLWWKHFESVDFLTYYRISPEASLPEMRIAIENEYTSMLEPHKKFIQFLVN
jgi:hypothetical protein